MLVDGGKPEEGENISEFLRNQGVKQLAVVVGTHPHSDHIGGLAQIINNFPVEKVYLPRVNHNTTTFEALLKAIKGKNLKISTARKGVEIPLEGIQARFIAPVGEDYEDLNNYSAVIRIDYGDISFILTGDAEEFSEKEMLASGEKLKADVLKAGHHGSSGSTCPAFLKAVSPPYAVIMCGADNDYGHPHRETLAALEAAGVKVYRTDLHGTIIMKSDGHNINIDTVGFNNKTTKNPPEQKQDNVYIGNKNSLKFHCSDCKSLPAAKNQVYFKTRDEAVKQGYSPCNKCQP
jgi:competence protein ComEC